VIRLKIGESQAVSIFLLILARSSLQPHLSGTCRRMTGTVLLLSIWYSNTNTNGDVHYAYKVAAQPDDSYSLSSTSSTSVSAGRLVRVKTVTAGVFVTVTQSGAIGEFDMLALLLNLAVGEHAISGPDCSASDTDGSFRCRCGVVSDFTPRH
jgi:hypothetical protein